MINLHKSSNKLYDYHVYIAIIHILFHVFSLLTENDLELTPVSEGRGYPGFTGCSPCSSPGVTSLAVTEIMLADYEKRHLAAYPRILERASELTFAPFYGTSGVTSGSCMGTSGLQQLDHNLNQLVEKAWSEINLNDSHVCPECNKRYSTASNLARHRQTHRSVSDKKARKCPHCDKIYVSIPAYSMHVRTHIGTHMRTHMRLCVCMYTCTYVCGCVWVCMYARVCVMHVF